MLAVANEETAPAHLKATPDWVQALTAMFKENFKKPQKPLNLMYPELVKLKGKKGTLNVVCPLSVPASASFRSGCGSLLGL